MNNTYYERKAKGICVKCGVNPAAEGHVSCEACMIKAREEGKRRWARIGETPNRAAYNRAWQKAKRHKRQDAGLCIQCGAPRMEGNKSFCERCYKMYRVNRQRRECRLVMEKLAQKSI